MPSHRFRFYACLWPWPRDAMLAAVLASALAGCAKAPQNTFQGYAEGDFVDVASSQAGRLDALSVHRGQSIAAGAPLYALESTDETAARNQAQALLRAAQDQLRDLHTGKRPPEVGVIQAQLTQARANAVRSAAQWRRDQAQYAAGGIAQAQLDTSQAQARSDAAHVRELESQLAVARLPGRDAQIAAQTAQVSAAQAALAQANWKLEQKTVAAPRAGLVFDTLYRTGEWVAAGAPVVRLLPPENIKVRFFVPETRLGQLRIGQTVTLRCDGCAASLPARITYISTQAEYTPPVIYSNEQRAKLVFMIEAHPTPTDATRLHPGQPVEVSLP